MGIKDLPDEPREMGAVIRVHNPQGKYPEIWVASNINIGSWYPDQGDGDHDYDCSGDRIVGWDLDPAAVVAIFSPVRQPEQETTP